MYDLTHHTQPSTLQSRLNSLLPALLLPPVHLQLAHLPLSHRRGQGPADLEDHVDQHCARIGPLLVGVFDLARPGRAGVQKLRGEVEEVAAMAGSKKKIIAHTLPTSESYLS